MVQLELVTTSDNEWQGAVQQVTTSGTKIDNEWQRMSTSDNEWQGVVISANFLLFLRGIY